MVYLCMLRCGKLIIFTGMFQIFLGSFVLSVIHASIPNHWLPVVAIGRAEGWSLRETLLVTAITGFAHTLSTVIIGISIGFIGHRLNEQYEMISEKIAPGILIVMGVIYIVIDRIRHRNHTHSHIDRAAKGKRSKWAVVVSLALAMFLSPCLEVEAYYFQAGTAGWAGIMLVSAVYVVVTVAGMVLLVFLGSKGIRMVHGHFFEHNEKLLSGLVLVLLGLFAWFVHF